MSFNLRRKVIGSLIASAVAFSMIPAMAFADTTGSQAVQVSISGTMVATADTPAEQTSNGITFTVAGDNSQASGNWIGVGASGGTYTISIDKEGAYAGGVITGVEIPLNGNFISCNFVSGEGWDANSFASGSTFTWSGDPTTSVSFTLAPGEGQSHYFNYSSITVYVLVPVDEFAVVGADGKTSGDMFVGDELPIFLDYVPENTTYDLSTVSWSVSPETEDVRVSTDEGGNYIVVADTTGVFEITATLVDVSATFTVYVGVEVDVLRLFYPDTGEHLYTIDMGEAAYLEERGWTIEGTAWTTPSISSTPVYRLFNENNGEHLYTADEGEAAHLETLGWKLEGTAWYAHDDSGVPVYRVFNPSATTNTHLITSDEGEIAHLVSQGWQNEGTAMYACPELAIA